MLRVLLVHDIWSMASNFQTIVFKSIYWDATTYNYYNVVFVTAMNRNVLYYEKNFPRKKENFSLKD